MGIWAPTYSTTSDWGCWTSPLLDAEDGAREGTVCPGMLRSAVTNSQGEERSCRVLLLHLHFVKML